MLKKVITTILTCLLAFFIFPIALAADQNIAIVKITGNGQSSPSEIASDVYVTLASPGQENSFHALLQLDDCSMDSVEKILPQQSMRIQSEEVNFVLYNDGNDSISTKIISAVCCSLISQGPIATPIRLQEPAEVYLNDEYWGLYTLRETIEDAVARFEGLDSTQQLNIADINLHTIWGDASALENTFNYISTLNLSKEDDCYKLNELFDIDSFLNWMTVNVFFGNSNMFGTLYFYQVNDGPWKCATGDFAYALIAAEDQTLTRLLKKDNVPARQRNIAILAEKVLSEAIYCDAFLKKVGAMYQALPATAMQSTVDTENTRISSALPTHMNRWADSFIRVLSTGYNYPVMNAQEAILFQHYRVSRLRNRIVVLRPWYVYENVQKELGLSDGEMVQYFGDSIPQLPGVTENTWIDYKSPNF